jgi:hypothetical protein
VYFTQDITSESLVSIYEALGVNREQELAILPLLKDFVRVEKFISRHDILVPRRGFLVLCRGMNCHHHL